MTLPEEDDQDSDTTAHSPTDAGEPEERFSSFVDDEELPFDEGDLEAQSLGAHGDSIVMVDDELAGRESYLNDAGLEDAEARAAFAEEIRDQLSTEGPDAVVDQIVDADPTALDAAAGIANSQENTGEPQPPQGDVARRHLRGLLEALLFVSDRPIKTADIAEVARADNKECRALLEELSAEYRDAQRGFQLDELAGGWQLRTSAAFAPFVREMTQQKPVRLTRAQVETLAIVAYRQPITRPEIEDVRGVDAGAVLKLLLDRNLVRILGKKDEPGRPLLYGTTSHFLEFFGLKSLRDLPTLREFSELTEESKEVVERELGEVLPEGPKEPAPVVGDESVAGVDVDPEAEGEEARAQAQAQAHTQAQAQAQAQAHTQEQAQTQAHEQAQAQDQGNEGLEEDAEEEQRPGGAAYDPSDEELFPDDDDEDFDDDDEDDEEEDDDDEDDADEE